MNGFPVQTYMGDTQSATSPIKKVWIAEVVPRSPNITLIFKQEPRTKINEFITEIAHKILVDCNATKYGHYAYYIHGTQSDSEGINCLAL